MRLLNFLLLLPILLALSACFHELDEETGEPDIFKPNLASEDSYQELLLKPQAVIDTQDDLQTITAKIFPRLLSHLSIFNLHIDLLPSGGVGSTVIKPNFKMQKPTYYIQSGSKCEENADVEQQQDKDVKNLQDRRSSFWFDADGDEVLSEGDDWIRLLSQCYDDSTNVLSVGTITFFDMSDQKLAIDGEDVAIEDMHVKARLQSDYNDGVNSKSILFNEMTAIYNRESDYSNSFAIQVGSKSAASQGEDQYIFVFDSASVSYVDTDTENGEFESVRFSGKYYDSEFEGYVVIDELVIDFNYYTDTSGDGNIRTMSVSINPDTDAATMLRTAEGLSFSFGEDDPEVHSYEDIFGTQGLTVVPMD